MKNLNFYSSGSIIIKNTRKKLYNYVLTDCSKEEIKAYILKHKNTTVFISSKQYAPEIKSYMIATKATNFDKYASISDKETFTKQRINFLNQCKQ